MRVNELKMFNLICCFILLRKRRKTILEISMIRCLNPLALTDVGMGQFTTTMAYDNLKCTDVQTSTILTQKSVAVLSFEGQNTRALKKFVPGRFYWQNLYYVAQLYTTSTSRCFL